MDISFCDDCDASIPRSDLDRGVARRFGESLLCAGCARKRGRGRATTLVLVPLALLAAAALGAATAVLALAPRLDRAERELVDAKGRLAGLEAPDPGRAESIRGLAEVDRRQSRLIEGLRESADRRAAEDTVALELIATRQAEIARELLAIKEHLAAAAAPAATEPEAPDVDELVALAVDQDPGARLSALVALEDVSDPRVQGILVGALADSDAVVRAEAARILGVRGGRASAGPLLDSLMDPDRRVRAVAHRALERVLGEGVAYDPLDPEEPRRKAVETLRSSLDH